MPHTTSFTADSSATLSHHPNSCRDPPAEPVEQRKGIHVTNAATEQQAGHRHPSLRGVPLQPAPPPPQQEAFFRYCVSKELEAARELLAYLTGNGAAAAANRGSGDALPVTRETSAPKGLGKGFSFQLPGSQHDPVSEASCHPSPPSQHSSSSSPSAAGGTSTAAPLSGMTVLVGPMRWHPPDNNNTAGGGGAHSRGHAPPTSTSMAADISSASPVRSVSPLHHRQKKHHGGGLRAPSRPTPHRRAPPLSPSTASPREVDPSHSPSSPQEPHSVWNKGLPRAQSGATTAASPGVLVSSSSSEQRGSSSGYITVQLRLTRQLVRLEEEDEMERKGNDGAAESVRKWEMKERSSAAQRGGWGCRADTAPTLAAAQLLHRSLSAEPFIPPAHRRHPLEPYFPSSEVTFHVEVVFTLEYLHGLSECHWQCSPFYTGGGLLPSGAGLPPSSSSPLPPGDTRAEEPTQESAPVVDARHRRRSKAGKSSGGGVVVVVSRADLSRDPSAGGAVAMRTGAKMRREGHPSAGARRVGMASVWGMIEAVEETTYTGTNERKDSDPCTAAAPQQPPVHLSPVTVLRLLRLMTNARQPLHAARGRDSSPSEGRPPPLSSEGCGVFSAVHPTSFAPGFLWARDRTRAPRHPGGGVVTPFLLDLTQLLFSYSLMEVDASALLQSASSHPDLPTASAPGSTVAHGADPVPGADPNLAAERESRRRNSHSTTLPLSATAWKRAALGTDPLLSDGGPPPFTLPPASAEESPSNHRYRGSSSLRQHTRSAVRSLSSQGRSRGAVGEEGPPTDGSARPTCGGPPKRPVAAVLLPHGGVLLWRNIGGPTPSTLLMPDPSLVDRRAPTPEEAERNASTPSWSAVVPPPRCERASGSTFSPHHESRKHPRRAKHGTTNEGPEAKTPRQWKSRGHTRHRSPTPRHGHRLQRKKNKLHPTLQYFLALRVGPMNKCAALEANTTAPRCRRRCRIPTAAHGVSAVRAVVMPETVVAHHQEDVLSTLIGCYFMHTNQFYRHHLLPSLLHPHLVFAGDTRAAKPRIEGVGSAEGGGGSVLGPGVTPPSSGPRPSPRQNDAPPRTSSSHHQEPSRQSEGERRRIWGRGADPARAAADTWREAMVLYNGGDTSSALFQTAHCCAQRSGWGGVAEMVEVLAQLELQRSRCKEDRTGRGAPMSLSHTLLDHSPDTCSAAAAPLLAASAYRKEARGAELSGLYAKSLLSPVLEEVLQRLQTQRLPFLAGVILCNILLPMVLHETTPTPRTRREEFVAGQTPSSSTVPFLLPVVALPPLSNWSVAYMQVAYVERVTRLVVLVGRGIAGRGHNGNAANARRSVSLGVAEMCEARIALRALEQYILPAAEYPNWKDVGVRCPLRDPTLLPSSSSTKHRTPSSSRAGSVTSTRAGRDGTATPYILHALPPLTECAVCRLSVEQDVEGIRKGRGAGWSCVVTYPPPQTAAQGVSSPPAPEASSSCGFTSPQQKQQQRPGEPEEVGAGCLVVQCSHCGHGGHVDHLQEWWKEAAVYGCPSGCGCWCSY